MGASGSPYTTFTFKVNDGRAESEKSATMTVHVTERVIMAPSDTALVSNIGQADASRGAISTFDRAQEFTTGDNSDGYTLTSVEISLYRSTVSIGVPNVDFTVAIWSRSETGQPLASLGALTRPTFSASSTSRVYEFTTTGIDLDAETQYFVVVDSSGLSNSFSIQYTSSDSEDSGAASGWSIGDRSLYRNSTAVGDYSTFAESSKIRIRGTEVSNNTPPASDGAVTTSLNTAYAFAADDFNFADADAGDALEKVKIIILPGAGTLALTGVGVAPPAPANVVAAEVSGDGDGEPDLKVSFDPEPSVTSARVQWQRAGRNWANAEEYGFPLVARDHERGAACHQRPVFGSGLRCAGALGEPGGRGAVDDPDRCAYVRGVSQRGGAEPGADRMGRQQGVDVF